MELVASMATAGCCTRLWAKGPTCYSQGQRPWRVRAFAEVRSPNGAHCLSHKCLTCAVYRYHAGKRGSRLACARKSCEKTRLAMYQPCLSVLPRCANLNRGPSIHV